MPLNRRQREEMLACCGEIQDDDGLDPRQFFRNRSRSCDKRDRKAQQLCRQVQQTPSLVLGGEFADEVLQSLFVESVVPAPNASQLLVTVSAADGSENAVESGLILQKQEQVSGQLRSEVAAAITRKKTRRLVFRVVLSRDPDN
jgi:ribosome-binding factor A